jgi:hypothetical protein
MSDDRLLLGRLRSYVGRAVRKHPAAAARLFIGPMPYLAAIRHRRHTLSPGTLACVYRRRNAPLVFAIVSSAERAGLTPRLWALDEPAPGLERITIGTGPGSRFKLLNLLANDGPAGWLAIADDDIRFVVPSSFTTMLAVATTAGVDISQPSHARGSWRSVRITRQRLFTSLRLTTFVEIGPVVLFSPRARELVLPFPEEGMGWGVELEWATLQDQGVRLGVTDCVPLVHLAFPGAGYDVHDELARLRDRVEAHGFSSFEEAQRVLETRRFV